MILIQYGEHLVLVHLWDIDLLKGKDTQVAKYEVFTVLEESHVFF